MPAGDAPRKSSLLKLRVSALEADLAYFAARLELIGTPATPHQRAQMKAYRTLEEALQNILERLQRTGK